MQATTFAFLGFTFILNHDRGSPQNTVHVILMKYGSFRCAYLKKNKQLR